MTPLAPQAVDTAFITSVMWYGFLSVAFIATGATIIGSIAFWRASSGQAKTFSLLIQRADATRLITIMLIIIVAFVLSLLGRVDSSATITLLSGVAGYVLGGSSANRKESPEAPEPPDKKTPEK